MRSSEKNRAYYRREHKWYDSTRNSFLFGRVELAKLISQGVGDRQDYHILEIGCGTGYMERLIRELGYMGNYMGVDVSWEMLSHAKSPNPRSVVLGSDIYNIASGWDCILFSYPLTLMDDWLAALGKAETMLNEGAVIGVADFHSSSNPLYTKYMNLHKIGINQGTMDYLNRHFTPLETHIEKAYMGIWKYFYGIWQKKN